MKNRTNQILLGAFLLTAALCVMIFLGDIAFSTLLFIIGVSIVPCFLLQLLICRTAKRLILKLIPVFLLVGVALLFVILSVTATGWDSLFWIITLMHCSSPAVGLALAWCVYGVGKIISNAKIKRDNRDA